MADWLNLKTLEARGSSDPANATDWRRIDRAELERIIAIPLQYRKLKGNTAVEMIAEEKAAVDATAEAARQTEIRRQAVEILSTRGEPMAMATMAVLLEVEAEIRAIKDGAPMPHRETAEIVASAIARVQSGEVG